MTTTQLKQQFTSVVDGANFMTPEVVRYHRAGKYVAELSRGKDMQGDYIWGVTVVDTTTTTPRHDLSEAFDTEALALAHIKTLGSKA